MARGPLRRGVQCSRIGCIGLGPTLIINNHSISPEDNLKNLGVLLDNKLSWKTHLQKGENSTIKSLWSSIHT